MRTSGNYIENPAAYEAATAARIKQNARIGRQRRMEAALAGEPELLEWLRGRGWIHQNDAPSKRHPAGPVPNFLDEALTEWGGLTDKQLAFARKIFAERTVKAEEIARQRAAEKANAPAWTEGRQQIEAVLLSWRESDVSFGYYSPVSYKGLFKLDDGRKVWMTVPSAVALVKGVRVRCSVKIEPKAAAARSSPSALRSR